MVIMLFLVMVVLGFIGFNRMMGYKKNDITIDLDERYTNADEHIQAVQDTLINQGRQVHYKGNRTFVIDGRSYHFQERTVPMGGVPLQRTILKPTHRK